MGLLDRMFSKTPAWAKGSTHDAKSAARLVEAIAGYVEDHGGSLALSNDQTSMTIKGPRGEKTFRLNEFVYICPADSPDTWGKMIALTLREVIPEAGLLKEARAAARKLLAEHREALDALDREAALSHLRLVLRVEAFRAEVPELRSVVRAGFDRFEAVAVYDFLPQADGLPAEHVDELGLDEAVVLERATANTFDQEVRVSDGLITSVTGPFAGSRILAPDRITTDLGFGALLTAPHRDLLLHHTIGQESPLLDTLDRLVASMYAQHDNGPAGGTGRSLFWWRPGAGFREIPTAARTILREGAPAFEYRLSDAFRREVLKPLGIDEPNR